MAKIEWIHLPVDLHPAQFVKILNLNKTLCNWTQSGWEETSPIERELLERCSINMTTILSYVSYICLLKIFFSKLAAVLWWSLASLAAYRESHQKLDIYIYKRIWGSLLCTFTFFQNHCLFNDHCLFIKQHPRLHSMPLWFVVQSKVVVKMVWNWYFEIHSSL